MLSPTIMRWVILARKVCGYFHTENYGDNRVEIDKELCEHVRLNIKGHNNLIHLSHIACNPYTYIYIQVEGVIIKYFWIRCMLEKNCGLYWGKSILILDR